MTDSKQIYEVLADSGFTITGVSTYPSDKMVDPDWFVVERPTDGKKIRIIGEFTDRQKSQIATIIQDLDLSATGKTDQEKKNRRFSAKALIDNPDNQIVLLKAILKLLLQVTKEEREYLQLIEQKLKPFNINLPPAPTVRNWNQLKGAIVTLIDNGEGD